MPITTRPPVKASIAAAPRSFAALVVHVDRVLAEARHAARVTFRAEGDDKRVGGDRAAVDLRLARVGPDRVDRARDHLDPTLAQGRERTLAFGQRRGADESPSSCAAP